MFNITKHRALILVSLGFLTVLALFIYELLAFGQARLYIENNTSKDIEITYYAGQCGGCASIQEVIKLDSGSFVFKLESGYDRFALCIDNCTRCKFHKIINRDFISNYFEPGSPIPMRNYLYFIFEDSPWRGEYTSKSGCSEFFEPDVFKHVKHDNYKYGYYNILENKD